MVASNKNLAEKILLQNTGRFGALFLDYLSGDQRLIPFYDKPPRIESFKEQIVQKSGSYKNRSYLLSAITSQYSGRTTPPKVNENLQRLSQENCFTVTTGHQLCLATGPLYFIYKVLTVIRLAEELKTEYPENEFVPVFWMATEDHDVEEINHFYLFGKKYEWQDVGKGPVGRLATQGLEALFSAIPDCPVWLEQAYREASSLAEATRNVVDYLFDQYGLVIIDGDDAQLKQLFVPSIKADLLNGKYAPLVRGSSEKLETLGYKAQAFARDQNFFFLHDGGRERIEKHGDQYVVLNTELSFSPSELEGRIEEMPILFSPNVLTRPLYQEVVLPNLAYIGGPGELAYWLQLKTVFEAENIPFPILFPRKFGTLVSKSSIEKLTVVGLGPRELFLDEKQFRSHLLDKLHVQNFDFEEEHALLATLKGLLQQKAVQADKSLIQAIEAEMAKVSKGIGELERRINKGLESRVDTDLKKLETIRKKLFPEGELQERHDNFMNFYINHEDLVQLLYDSFDPFAFDMEIIHI